MGGRYKGWLAGGVILFASTGARAGDGKPAADNKTAAADSKPAGDAKPFPPCTTTPTDADRKAAQGAFQAGHGSFNEGDYPTAITYWRDAYRRDCTAHLLLVNLARAYELQGQRPEALAALETYLERKPDASDADQIRRRIDNLKTQIAAAQTAAPPPPPTPAPAPAAPPPAAEAQAKTGSRSAVPLVIAGVGGAVALVGLLVVGGGAAKVADAEKKCPDRQNCPPDVAQMGNDGRNQQKAGGFLTVTGLLVGAGGLIWYFVSSPSGRTADAPHGLTVGRTEVTPAVGSGFTGVQFAGSF